MVHVDEHDNIIRAYTYVDEIADMKDYLSYADVDNKEWFGRRSINPLFQYLTSIFVREYIDEIRDQISEERRREVT